MDSTRIGGAPVTTALYARFSASVVSGVITSLIGGVVMALVLVVAYTSFQHTSVFYPLRPIGSFLYGDEMLVAPTAAMYLAATGFHFGVVALWGIVFGFAAALLRVDKSYGGSLALGLVIGMLSHFIDINLVTPPVMATLWGRDYWAATVPPLYSFIGHLAFGATFVIAPAMFRGLWLRFSGRGDILADDPRIR